MWVQSLGWEDLLEKEMAIHSSILAGIIPWTEEPGGIQCMGSQRVDMTEQLSMRACKWITFPIKSQRMPEQKLKNMIQVYAVFNGLIYNSNQKQVENKRMEKYVPCKQTKRELEWLY